MGMSIEHVNKLLSVITATITEDDDCFTIEDENLQVLKEALLIAIDAMRKYQLFQVEYTKRLRADMVAMLEDLDLQIEALEEIPPYDIMDDWEHQICVRTWEVKQIIKEKINSLKED